MWRRYVCHICFNSVFRKGLADFQKVVWFMIALYCTNFLASNLLHKKWMAVQMLVNWVLALLLMLDCIVSHMMDAYCFINFLYVQTKAGDAAKGGKKKWVNLLLSYSMIVCFTSILFWTECCAPRCACAFITRNNLWFTRFSGYHRGSLL